MQVFPKESDAIVIQSYFSVGPKVFQTGKGSLDESIKLKRFNCTWPGCEKSFNRESKVELHVQTAHLGEKPFKCEFCENCYNRKSYLDRHMISRHGDKVLEKSGGEKPWTEYPCQFPGCTRVFLEQQKLKRHMKKHNKPRNEYKCSEPGCDACFHKRQRLREHLGYVHGREDAYSWVCGVEGCGKRFMHEWRLIKHKNSQHKDNQKDDEVDNHEKSGRYVCGRDGCVFRYNSISQLRGHCLQAHGESASTCPNCKQIFVDERGLRRHICSAKAVEQDSKTPFKCDQCHKSFARKRYLALHKRIKHEGVKAFKCSFCDKSFAYRKSQILHEKKMHSLVDKELDLETAVPLKTLEISKFITQLSGINRCEFICPNCKAGFQREYDLKRHQCLQNT